MNVAWTFPEESMVHRTKDVDLIEITAKNWSIEITEQLKEKAR